jgi:hypothetical protein
MYATTRYRFVRLKVTHKISPLEELIGGDLLPSSSQRLTGVIDVFFLFVSVLNQLHPISIYIVHISVLLVVFHMMNEG